MQTTIVPTPDIIVGWLINAESRHPLAVARGLSNISCYAREALLEKHSVTRRTKMMSLFHSIVARRLRIMAQATG